MTDFLEVIRERGSGALDKKMGIQIIEASPNRLVGTMPVEGNTQPIGLLHGGANVVLAESLGSIGTQLHAGPNRRIVGVDINATHHKHREGFEKEKGISDLSNVSGTGRRSVFVIP